MKNLKKTAALFAPVAALAAALTIGTTGCGGREAPAPSSQEASPELLGPSLERTLEELTIELDVQHALLTELGVEGIRVDTQVSGNDVTLTGQVHDAATLAAAEEIVAGLVDVGAVRNELTVAPVFEEGLDPDQPAEALELELADAVLEVGVRLRLYGAVGLEAQRIDVEATDGTVTLRGWLPTEEKKTEAMAAVEAAEGVGDVIDGIQVTQPVEYDG